MLKRLLQLVGDSLAYGISGLLGQLIGLLLLPLYTRRLEASDYGVLAMLAFLPPVFSALVAAGAKSAVFQQFYRCESDRQRRLVLSTAAISVLVGSLLLLAVTLTAAPWIAELLIGDAAVADLVRLSLLSAAVVTLTDIPLIALQALRKAKTVGVLNLIQLVVVVSITIYLVVVLRWGVLGVVLGSLIGSCVWSVICFATAARFFAWGFDVDVWREMAAYSLPFMPHRLQAAAMTFFGDYMIRVEMGTDDVGLYSVATRFALPIGFLASALHQAWNPYKFKVFAEDANPGAFFRSTLTYFVFVLCYLWVGISVWGPEAVRLFTAPSFHAAALLVWAVALMRAAQAFYPMMATGIELAKDTRTVPLTSFVALVTMVVGCLWLVPRYGPYGAAFSSTAAWLVMAAAFFIIAQRQVRIDYDWLSIACLCGLAVLMVATGVFLQPYALAVRLAAAVTMSLVYPALGLVVLARSPSERHRMEILLEKVLGIRAKRPAGQANPL